MTEKRLVPRRTLTWQDRCQKCNELVESTKQRTFRTKNFIGPCGDSFCYASCDMEACRPMTATICDDCETELKQ